MEELSLSECNQFWKSGDLISSYEKFKIIGVTGGIPRYLEEISFDLPAEENIRKLCFQKEGLLFGEFERIFSDLFSKRSEIYKKIVLCLAQGAKELEDIFKSLKMKKSGVISDYLDDLIHAGFVTRDFTWNIRNEKNSKLSHYRLSDNYLRFYLKYIEPNKDKIQKRPMSLPVSWHSILGLQFENLVLKNRQALHHFLKVDPSEIICDNPYFQSSTKLQVGCQIDYLVQTKFNVLYACEIKFSNKEIKREIINEMDEKLKKFIRPKGFSIRPILIHVNGVSDSVIEADYFSNIISFGEFLK